MIGLSLEPVLAIAIWEVDSTITDKQNEQISAAQTEASRANERAANAVLKAANLGVTFDKLKQYVNDNERAAIEQMDSFKKFAALEKTQADSVIAELNSNRDRLEKARADALIAAAQAKQALAVMEAANKPRGLSSPQRTVFVEHLKKFHDTVVSVWRFSTTSPDSISLGIALRDLLTEAKWKSRGVSTSWGSGFAKGIVVLNRSEGKAAVAEAVIALVRELNDDGLAAVSASDLEGIGGDFFLNGMMVGGPNPDIVVVVGTKP